GAGHGTRCRHTAAAHGRPAGPRPRTDRPAAGQHDGPGTGPTGPVRCEGCSAGKGRWSQCPGPWGCGGSGGVGVVGLGLGLRRHVGLGDLDELREGGLVVHGQLGQHAAVDLDLRGLQALDEPVVGHAVGAGRGVDPLDPQATEVTLAGATVTVAVDQRVGDLLLGLAVEAGPLAPVAAGALEGNPALLVGVDRPLHACHVSTPSVDGCWAQRPSSFLAVFSSGPDRTLSLARRRAAVAVRSWNLWTWRARWCMILPVPVTRKRFLAPLSVFIFGMCRSPRCVIAARSRRVPAWNAVVRASAGGAVDLEAGPGVGALDLDGVLLGVRGLLGALLVAHGGLLLGGPEDHHHVATVLLRGALDEAQLGDVLRQPLQQTEAQLGPRLLATAEHDRHLDLVATLEEANDVTLLGLVVVAVDLGAELDLLDDRVDLVLPRLTGLHGGFVLVLAEVHELGDRWARHRSHLDQVEIGFGGQAQRVFDAHDPDLLTVWANQPHFRDPDAVVDSRLADCLLLRSCQWTPRNEERPLVTV